MQVPLEWKLKYEIMPPVGPGRFPREGALAEMLFDIPYFFVGAIVPPIQILNEVLKKGVVDMGMSGGCKWEPFQVDDAGYSRLVGDLVGLEFVVVEPPEWVTTHSDWSTWCRELVWGVPALESKRQWDEIKTLWTEIKVASKAGEVERVKELRERANQQTNCYLQFATEHRAPNPKIPLACRPLRKGDSNGP
jgi:hypothetical protein